MSETDLKEHSIASNNDSIYSNRFLKYFHQPNHKVEVFDMSLISQSPDDANKVIFNEFTNILDHPIDHISKHLNVVCGDDVTIAIEFDGLTVKSLYWSGQACTVTTVCISLLSKVVENCSIDNIRNLSKKLLTLCYDDYSKDEFIDDLFAFASSIKKVPSRIKCFELPIKALLQALDSQSPEIPSRTD